MSTRILYIAEIVGKAGIFAVKKVLPGLKKELGVDLVIAGGDGVTGGSGIGRNHAMYLRKLGIDVICAGDFAYYKQDMMEQYDKGSFVLRPVNYPRDTPGRGIRICDTPSGKVAVAVLLGQAGFSRVHLDNPFLEVKPLHERLSRDAAITILDFHATTTAEKATLFAMADGLFTAVIGSHTRVPSADERVLAGGTAVVSDAGRTGSALSVGGLDPATRIREYMTGIPDWSRDAWAGTEFQALLVEAGQDGKARSIRRITAPVEVPDEEVGLDQGGD